MICEGRIFCHHESFERKEGASYCSGITGVNKPELSQATYPVPHRCKGNSIPTTIHFKIDTVSVSLTRK